MTTSTQSTQIRLPASIYLIGVVSMLNDVATELITPLIPLLLATNLAAGPLTLGIVEGIANAVAALLRLWAGQYSDASGGKRKPLAIAGYTLSSLVRPMFALVTTAWQVVLLRAIDRVGKGIRSAPRDALIVDLSPPSLRARAFGIHSALDNLGAVGGALLGAWILIAYTTDLKNIVLISSIPGALAILLLIFAVKEPHKHQKQTHIKIDFHWQAIPAPLRQYLIIVMLFTFARASELFIILRAHELGASNAHALIIWAAFNFIKIFANYGAGALADRYGRLALLVPGWALHSTAMFGLCFADSITSLWVATLYFGFAMSISEGVERAVISDHTEANLRGTLFGWYYAMVGIASIPAGILLGWLWQSYGAVSAYSVAGIIGTIATLHLRYRIAPWLPRNQGVANS